MNTIIFSGHTITNVGNSFVHHGAKFITETAIHNACDIPLSSIQSYWFYLNRHIEIKPHPFWKEALIRLVRRFNFETKSLIENEGDFSEQVKQGQIFSVIENAKVDLLVIPGMTICSEFIRVNGVAIKNAVKNGVKILFLGVGGEFYNNKERVEFLKFLDAVQPIGIRTRDEGTYEMLKAWHKDVCLGMDCAFFANDFRYG
jgi:hypothetical protein